MLFFQKANDIWQMSFFLLFFEIEIVISIALWWSGLSPLIFPLKRRRVMLEGRNGQTRGRQIRRRGKRRERRSPGSEVYISSEKIDSCVLSIKTDDRFHWGQLLLCRVDYGLPIRFDSLSDHSWLYFPCCFFCCLECHVNRILPSLSTSVHADFLLARWTGWLLVVSS